MDKRIDFEMGEKREALDMSTQGNGTLATSTSILTSTLKPFGTFLVPLHPSTIISTTGMVLVFQYFL